ncbi:cysteine desulfurase family protein [Thiohalorhabdus methylotrophus]|uniref:Cysteine desulfurase family protein n=1 Tax=Thiohalorhabdus methylotrophus TaxID=3242694 RepID=A0ABV4TUA8_9GAMM
MGAYLDYNATAPPDPAVRGEVAECLAEGWGNPSSVHGWGRRARSRLETARERVAALAGCSPREVSFTGGATEANNAVLKGFAWQDGGARTLLVGATEHPSVRETARYLAGRGFPVAEVAVDGEGRVTPAALREALEAHGPVGLVSVMWANNETGVLQPVAELAAVCAEYGIPLHTDAVQAAGKMPVDFAGSGAAAMSLSAHKIGGPQGVGALIRDARRLPVDPFLHGGGHERERRAGTENVAGILGFGVAAGLARERLEAAGAHARGLRDRLEDGLRGAGVGVEVVGDAAERLPNTSCLLLPDVEAETLLMNLDLSGFAVSSGSACASGSLEPSPVLLAMGIPSNRARGSLRVSTGWATTAGEVEAFLETLVPQVRRLQDRAVHSA